MHNTTSVKTRKSARVRKVSPEFLERVGSRLQVFFESLMSDWSTAHEEQLKEFLEIQNGFMELRAQLRPEDFEEFWRRLEAQIQKLSDWTKSLDYVDESLTPAAFWQEFRRLFNEFLADIPVTLNITIPGDYWRLNPGDSSRVRIWKRTRQIRLKLWQRMHGMRNSLMRALGRTPFDMQPPKRRAETHNFLGCFYEIPVARHMLLQWQDHLKQTARQLHALHEALGQLNYKLLFLENLQEVGVNADFELMLANLKEIEQLVARLETLSSQQREAQAAKLNQLRDFLSELVDDVYKKWQFAGTFILPGASFSKSKAARSWNDLEKEFAEARDAWAKHFRGEKADWLKDLDLNRLQIQVTQICIITMRSIDEKVDTQILPAFTEPQRMLADSLEKFQRMGLENYAELETEILSENRHMIRTLRREKLPDALHAIADADLMKTLENFFSRTRYSIDSLEDNYCIFQNSDLDTLPPKSILLDTPLKNLIHEEIYPEMARKQSSFKAEIQASLDHVVRDISEIDQIVDFNLEAALELLDRDDQTNTLQEAQNVALQGLERASNRLNDLLQKNSDLVNACRKTLWSITTEFERNIQDLADDDKIIELRLRVAKAKAREGFREYQAETRRFLTTTIPSVRDFVLQHSKALHGTYLRYRNRAGLAPTGTDIEDELALYVDTLHDQIDKLPYVYQRLFRIEPLGDSRFTEGREAEMELLQNEFLSWQAGLYGVTALVGEKGSGKTTLVNQAKHAIYHRLPVIQIDLVGTKITSEKSLFRFLLPAFEQEAASIDELEGLLRQGGRRVVIVEDLQNLFLRTVDGFEALERFLLLVSRTHDTTHWVISCTLYSWRYLDKVLNISKFFQRCIYLSVFATAQLESIVLKRHRVSGYKLHFEATPEITDRKRFKKLKDEAARQAFLRELYFEQLSELAAGNITVTMLFWLSAIKKIERDMMVVTLRKIETSFLEHLANDELFTLGAMIQHEMLSTKEHAMIFHLAEPQSLLLLNRMTNRGLLYQKANGYYQIDLLLYRAAVRALSLRNVIH